jgi:hypothetical protein
MKISKILIADLTNRFFSHFFIKQFIVSQIDLKDDEINVFQIDMKNINSFSYVTTIDRSDRYISENFYEIMIDFDVSRYSTVEYEQYLAYVRNNYERINIIKAETIYVQFEIDFIFSVKSLIIDISIEIVEFHIVKIDTSFILSLADMNRLKVYFNNVENIFIKKKIRKDDVFSVIRRFGHGFLLWKNALRTYITQSFDENSCFLTETELRQLHRRFGHPSVLKLQHLLERAGHDVEKPVLEKLTKFCHFCQKYAKSSGRFKFTLKDDVNFNFSIIVDIMYIENSLILHVIDEVTRFQAAKWLQNISAKHT